MNGVRTIAQCPYLRMKYALCGMRCMSYAINAVSPVCCMPYAKPYLCRMLYAYAMCHMCMPYVRRVCGAPYAVAVAVCGVPYAVCAVFAYLHSRRIPYSIRRNKLYAPHDDDDTISPFGQLKLWAPSSGCEPYSHQSRW
jgi:hypothetical protein